MPNRGSSPNFPEAVRTEGPSISGTLLPSNLGEALRRLADNDLDKLLLAVAQESARRHGSPGSPPPLPQLSRPAAGSTMSVAGITSGQANAVRAATKAGIKPAVIARQFGLSLATVRQLLTSRGPVK